MKWFLPALCVIGLGVAKATETSGNGTGFMVRFWQSEEGLPGNVVRSLGQTRDGFLWVATAEGIARFDGIEFLSISAGAPYRGRRFGFFRIFTPSNDEVWVSTFLGGLARIDDGRLTPIIEDREDAGQSVVTHLFSHANLIYFIRDRVLWRLTPDGAVEVADPPQGVRLAMNAHLRADRKRGRRDDRTPPERLIDDDGDQWSIVTRSLIHKADGNGVTTVVIPELEGRMIANDMLQDHEGNLWIGSPVHGLIRVRKSRVASLQTENGPYLAGVQTAVRDREGTWWIGSRGGGIDCIRDGVVERLELTEGGYPRPVACIFEQSDGTLWFASRDGTVFRRNGESFEAPFNRPPVVSQVNAIAEDPTGKLWFAGGRGICHWNGETVTDFRDHPGMDKVEFSALAVDDKGQVFSGTIDGRIFVSDGSSVTSIETPSSLSRHWISSLMVLEDGEIWVATVGAGLFARREGEWHRFSSEDGLPDERLTGMTLVDQDQVWLGSLGGILRASRSELLRRTTNRSIVPRWVRLDRSDGMATRECVGGSQPGIFTDSDGSLWFPTSSGIAGVQPEKVRGNFTPPSLYLHPVEIDGLPHPIDQGEIIAGPGSAQIDFRFVGLSLSAPEKVTYRIQLKPLEDSPSYVGTQRTASYQAVPPGRYTFEVLAMNGDGIGNILPASVTVVVEPHVWETPWFITTTIILALLVTLAIGWLIARRRMKRSLEALRVQQLVEGERSRISRDLHDDLGASLTELSILSALGAEDPEEENLRPTMETLSSKSKQVVGTLDEIVWAATPREDTLRSLIDYLAAFAREFIDNTGLTLRLEATRDIPDLMIGPRRRHNVFLTTREAINNAVKHSGAEAIKLRISIEDAHLKIDVMDDGKGFDLEYAEHSGNGLANLRQRMEDCGGSCTIESIPGQGTSVCIQLPLPLPT